MPIPVTFAGSVMKHLAAQRVKTTSADGTRRRRGNWPPLSNHGGRLAARNRPIRISWQGFDAALRPGNSRTRGRWDAAQ